MDIGFKIRKARELRNYSQEYVAFKIGISQASYSKIEAGQTKLELKRLQEIAIILEVDLFYLLNHNVRNDINGCIQCKYRLDQQNLLADDERILYLRWIKKLETEIEQLRSG